MQEASCVLPALIGADKINSDFCDLVCNASYKKIVIGCTISADTPLDLHEICEWHQLVVAGPSGRPSACTALLPCPAGC